jgi:hypothetical protein
MSRLQTFPYLVPSPDRIKIKGWQIQKNDTLSPLEEYLPGWDPATILQILVAAEVNTRGVFEDCKLAPDARVRIALVWFSPGTGLRGHGDFINLETADSSWSGSLKLTAAGEMLASSIRLETQLVLVHAGSRSFPLAPERSGSLLWREGKTVALEGQESRFPVELTDFAASSGWLPADAGWYLEWDPHDLHQLALGSMRLLINKGNKQVSQAVTESQPADKVIRDAIRYDVGRIMIVRALENDDFVTAPDDYAEGSIGATIRRLIQMLFQVPSDRFKGLQQVYRQDPSRFECRLQDRLRLFQEI